MRRNSRGFTLVELGIVMVIIGVLAGISISSYKIYVSQSAYVVAQTTVGFARTALSASQADPDDVMPDVPGYIQTTGGSITDPDARKLLPAMMVPNHVKFQATHDSTCDSGACFIDFIQVNHCQGLEYIVYSRRGDGTELLLENVSGAGCP